MKIIDVSCAIIFRDGKILAAQRNVKGKLPLKWEFPGGKVESGETLEESLIREIREELGMEIRILKALSPVLHHYPNLSVKLWPFVCSSEKGEPILKEHHAILWLEKEELEGLDWAEADVGVFSEFSKVWTD